MILDDLRTDLELLRPISLDELPPAVSLTRRFELKRVGRTPVVSRIIEQVAHRMRVLEVDGARVTPVTSVYFDTPDAALFRAHAQGRRRRFKVRIRHYADRSSAMLEVKAKGLRGQTVKYRTAYDSRPIDRLDAQSIAYVSEVLEDAYGLRPPEPLQLAAITEFERVTLVDLEGVERLTIDQSVTVSVRADRWRFASDGVIIESKVEHPARASVRSVEGLDLRTMPVSKYCLAMALAHPDLSGNRWLPAVRWFSPGST